MYKEFTKIVVRTPESHNPNYLIIEGTFVKEDGEKAVLTYYTPVGKKDPMCWGHEYYSGPNYIPTTSGGSYSRNWVRGTGMPSKYNVLAHTLKIKSENIK
jgi:hypothetical protein